MNLVLLCDHGYEHQTVACAVSVPDGIDLHSLLTEFEQLIGYTPKRLGELSYDGQNEDYEIRKRLPERFAELGLNKPEHEYQSNGDILSAFAEWLERNHGCLVVPFDDFGYEETTGRIGWPYPAEWNET